MTMNWQNEAEARKEDRIELLFDPLLLDKEGRVIARVADLSMSGALLYVRRGVFVVGETVEGWLQSPPQDGGDELFVAVKFIVRWISNNKMAGWSQMGCEMGELDSASAETLKRLIDVAAP
jgi:hypothetical protein